MMERSSTDKASQLKLNAAELLKNVKTSREKSPFKQEVTVCAATKTQSAELINMLPDLGITTIGENRVQELLDKYPLIDKDRFKIHFIGHLQSNKVKYIIDKVDMIQSLDSLSLAKEIDRQAKKHSKIMNVLCQINIGREESKSGVDPDKVEEFLLSIKDLTSIKVQGLMAIPPICEDFSVQKQYFQKIMQIFIDIKGKNMDNINMHILSFGMSGDYCQAIECGANMIRPGTALFGKRDYNKEN